MDRPLYIGVPGSKSMTHRALILAAMAKGDSILTNCLKSDDIAVTMNALKCMGAGIDIISSNQLKIKGTGGIIKACNSPICMEESGTSLRLLSCIAALGNHEYLLIGKGRLNERPMIPLLDALGELKVTVKSIENNGCAPISIMGPASGNEVHINASLSSQFLSGLLIIGGVFEDGLNIKIESTISSLPYVYMTIDAMKHFGIQVEKVSEDHFKVFGGGYKAADYNIEGDASSASYFWAGAALTGKYVCVPFILSTSLQTDMGILGILKEMGAEVIYNSDGSIIVHGKELKAIKMDVNHIPDQVPTLALLAAFAKGKSRFTSIAHLRHKESDRIFGISENLKAMKIKVNIGENFIEIDGGNPQPATIRTLNDHRLAMAFSLAGLMVKDIKVDNLLCVNKSFPDFWKEFEKLKI